MKELTVQEFMEMMQAEGLLTNAMDSQMATMDSTEVAEPEEDDDDDLDELCEEVPLLIVTADEDRSNTTLDPLGCVTDDFRYNPLFLFEHGLKLPIQDSILGKINGIKITKHGIIAQAEYIILESNSLPKKMKEMETNGLIPGNSIGWRPLADITMSDDGHRRVGKWELLEVSKVLIPKNGKTTNLRLA